MRLLSRVVVLVMHACRAGMHGMQMAFTRSLATKRRVTRLVGFLASSLAHLIAPSPTRCCRTSPTRASATGRAVVKLCNDDDDDDVWPD